MGSKPKVALEQVLVEGSFECHVCGESVDAAVYLPSEQVLTWKCANGHKSFIEKFRL